MNMYRYRLARDIFAKTICRDLSNSSNKIAGARFLRVHQVIHKPLNRTLASRTMCTSVFRKATGHLGLPHSEI